MIAFVLPLLQFDVRLEVVILGAVTGLGFGLAAVGLVLVYRAARVINLGFGEMGALPAAVLLVLVARNDWPYWGAFAAAIGVAVLVGVVAELVLMERLRDAPRLVVLVGTIGLGQLCLAGALFLPVVPPGGAGYPTPFTTSWTIGDLVLTPGHLMIIVAAPLLMAGLTLFLRRSTLGLAILAYGHNPEGARLVGIRTRRVALAVWIIVSVLSAASAVLVSGVTAQAGQQPAGPQVLLPAMAAALVGALSSLPIAFGAGVAIGIVGSLTTWNYPSGGTFELVLLVVIMGTLLYRREIAGRGGEEATWSLTGVARAARRAGSPWLRRGERLVPFVAAAALVPLLDSGHTVLATSVVLFALMGLSVVVLTGFAGQISLAQFAFVGLGAIVGGRAFQLGYPIWVQAIYAAVAGGLVALLVGIPALRVKGPYLAVTSLAFAVAANSWLLRQQWLVKTDASGDSLRIPRQELLGIDLGSELSYYYVCLAALAAGVIVVTRMRRTGFGRTAMATRDNELSAQSMTVAPRRVKLKVFVLAGTIASIAGYLYGGLLVSFGRVGLFDPSRSVDLLAMVIFGGVSTVSGAVLGAMYVRGIPYFFGQNWGLLATGAGLLIALQFFPDGLASAVGRITGLRRRVPAEAESEAVVVTSIGRLSVREPEPGPTAEPGLGHAITVEDVSVAFGGVVAVDHVSLEVPAGQIVALVGPNGAGKTTLFDAVTGHVPIRTGRVSVFDTEVTSLRPEERAAMGLGRTFQQARLYPELSLRESLMVSLEAQIPTEAVPSLMGLPPSRRAEHDQAFGADALLDLFNLGSFADRICGELSTGVRRLGELACVVGVGARVVMLDEPTAGLAQREVEQFPEILRQVRAHLGATLVVIDHDMPVLAELADRMVVLSAGSVIADGRPDAVQADPDVIAAYLGTDERVIRRSGASARPDAKAGAPPARLTAKARA